MRAEMIVETRLIKTGRPTAHYEVNNDGSLHLREITLPEISFPFDVAILPNTCTAKGEHLQALLIGDISHPTETHITVRIIGGIQSSKTDPLLLGVPVVDGRYDELKQAADLSAPLRKEVLRYLGDSSDKPGRIKWLDPDDALSHILQAVARMRQCELETHRQVSEQAAWKPAHRDGRLVGYTAIEHYTDAEYTYFQLPYRFQYYMDQHLASDERILFALSRPAMRSHLQRSWLRQKKLQQGVLILTNQRLLHLVELVPPGSSGVRYGFQSHVGILERLDAAKIVRLENRGLVLQTTWRAADGAETLEWEFPVECESELAMLFGILSKFLADTHRSSTLRRAALPPVPETIPALRDPAVNDPQELEPLQARFLSHLPSLLVSGEEFIAWALLPGWFDSEGIARILLVSSTRLRVIPDPIHRLQTEIDIAYRQISTLEYVGSILSSHIDLSLVCEGEIRKLVINFPYPAEHSFHTCFEAIRRCAAITAV